MSKRKQPQTNRNNIDTSFLFPDTLRGRKYIKHKDFLRIDTFNILLNKSELDKFHIYLEKYLETEDPNYLLKAVKANLTVLQGKPQKRLGKLGFDSLPLDVEPDTIVWTLPLDVDAYTIVWETILWWRERFYYHRDKEAKKNLAKLGAAFTNFPRGGWRITWTRDGIVHVTPFAKGTNTHLESSGGFIQYWNHIENIFRDNVKKRYPKLARPLPKKAYSQYSKGLSLIHAMHKEKDPKITDIRGIIENKLGDKVSENEVKCFELSSIGKMTTSYLAWRHKKLCPICRKDKLGYKTVLTLYKKAKKDLAKQELNRPS